MKKPTITRTSRGQESSLFTDAQGVPAILVAYAPAGTTTVDRASVTVPFTVGRGSNCSFIIQDDRVSKRHFRITKSHEGYWLEDLGSTNGTFMNGLRATTKHLISNGSVIRVGSAVLIFHEDAEQLLEPAPMYQFDMAGRFHTGPLMRNLNEAAVSRRHVLLVGPSGTGKELAAKALASMMGKPDKPLKLLAHNAARFSSEEEAASTLFGVASRVFSNVDARPGLIEQANGGLLFLDEVHNLPQRVQRSLLRVIEDGEVARIGETGSRQVVLQFVFASNAPSPFYGLAHDLVARLREVKVPPLAKRVADVPTIFDTLLRNALKYHSVKEEIVFPLLRADHYEALCLDGFVDDNIRGLADLADRLATRVATGTELKKSIKSVFTERFGRGPVAKRQRTDEESLESSSHYEKNKGLIIDVYRECGGNIAATERNLLSKGFSCSRRWLTIYAKQWGLR